MPRKSKSKIIAPTAAEDRAINRGIKSDPDARELTEADFAQMRPFREVSRLGRPRQTVHKKPVTIRLDPHIVEHFRAKGRGWQTEINDALAGIVKRTQRK